MAVNRKHLEVAHPGVCDFLGNHKTPLIYCIIYVDHGRTHVCYVEHSIIVTRQSGQISGQISRALVSREGDRGFNPLSSQTNDSTN